MNKTALLKTLLSLSFLIATPMLANENIDDPFSDDNVITIDAKEAVKEAELNSGKENNTFDEINDKQKDVLSVIKKKGKPSIEDVSHSIKDSIFGKGKNVTEVKPLQKEDNLQTLTEQESKENIENSTNNSYTEPEIVKLEPVANIKYYKELSWFSVIDHEKSGFAEYVKKLNLPSFTLDQLKNRTDSGLALVVNALAYDYGLHDAGMAEIFYQEFLGRNDISFYDRELRYADFLIRTGRPQKVLEFLNNGKCMKHLNFMASCDYYLGMARYLLTGDNKNVNLRSAKDYFDKAGIIFYQNEKR